mmetsp:Transcript_4109/g.8870  ORF Transcript_4109/g.8870 Transcript_4109/m.8870 type:complete len:494 (-) Transcript_4109:77-1558(-)|eukprot:CAMPEP_0171576752 /NCGR_PEP_ID=MMETSP0961-20121227/6807_1 /TAXON_ID=87120 /ORGANISM="Aurantiochytrium limacinum, Strain ATCCMYA-1381" /LENGTH=493 /DNA_ID=CAMNT_0012132653 /DNA_START=63 /DNA_END=1544 /DNA_ORIENTATION=+
MQGGRSDNSVLGSWGGSFLGRGDDSEAESSGWESEVEIRQPLSLGHRLDAALHSLRTAFALTISLPIAWLCLHPSIASFREHKFRRVEAGTKTVLAVQHFLRCKLLDIYFQVFSFCAEEEFYLLALPFLIWNVDNVLGRRLTLVVCVGLIAGNIAKDVFQLPRPQSPPVWRPAIQEHMDSTGVADFGFPSTHAMNAVSNSVFVLLYNLFDADSLEPEKLRATILQTDHVIWIVLTALYILSLSLSRLYVGVHTPTDIRGGLALGCTWVAMYFPLSAKFDRYYLSTPLLSFKLMAATVLMLLLNPQPRPITPTFMQNALLAGLIFGCVLGSRHLHDLGPIHVDTHGNIIAVSKTYLLTSVPDWMASIRNSIHDWTLAHSGLAVAARTVAGYVVVLLLRVVAKILIINLLRLVGISIVPRKEEEVVQSSNGKKSPKKNNKRRKRRTIRVVHLFTRDIDVVGNAVVKVFVYTVLAWAITFFVPVLYQISGLKIAQT